MKIYLYDNNYCGVEIVKARNQINVMENTRNIGGYSVESNNFSWLATRFPYTLPWFLGEMSVE
jgi:hypothetical protein